MSFYLFLIFLGVVQSLPFFKRGSRQKQKLILQKEQNEDISPLSKLLFPNKTQEKHIQLKEEKTKARGIFKNIRSNRKRKGEQTKQENTVFKGSANSNGIRGDKNVISGDSNYNAVQGSKNKVDGHANLIQGSSNFIKGSGNSINNKGGLIKKFVERK